MNDGETKSSGIGRRQFITKAGSLVLGATVGWTSGAPRATAGDVPISGVIRHDPAKCVGCGVCSMMCSLLHEGAVGPALSRLDILREPFTYDFTFVGCQQCASPGCYHACPKKDVARCIDETTGARYVVESECIGCGACIKACPFDPPRTKMHPERKVAITCDLCRDRAEGPICVDYCAQQALTYVTKKRRGD